MQKDTEPVTGLLPSPDPQLPTPRDLEISFQKAVSNIDAAARTTPEENADAERKARAEKRYLEWSSRPVDERTAAAMDREMKQLDRFIERVVGPAAAIGFAAMLFLLARTGNSIGKDDVIAQQKMDIRDLRAELAGTNEKYKVALAQFQETDSRLDSAKNLISQLASNNGRNISVTMTNPVRPDSCTQTMQPLLSPVPGKSGI